MAQASELVPEPQQVDMSLAMIHGRMINLLASDRAVAKKTEQKESISRWCYTSLASSGLGARVNWRKLDWDALIEIGCTLILIHFTQITEYIVHELSLAICGAVRRTSVLTVALFPVWSTHCCAGNLSSGHRLNNSGSLLQSLNGS
jgi:hypothetical protein